MHVVFAAPDLVKVVNMNGKLKSSRRQAAELHFDFPVESLGESGTVTERGRLTTAFVQVSAAHIAHAGLCSFGSKPKKLLLVCKILFHLFI